MNSPLDRLGKTLTFALVVLAISTVSLSAQSFSPDARLIGMGGVGEESNDALKMAGEARSYRSIGLPLGLIQLVKNRAVLNPDDDRFDPAQAIGYAISPLHIMFDRSGSPASQLLVSDLVNAGIDRNLTTYRGFAPKPTISGKGLVAPNWGKTFNISSSGPNRSQGFYVGAGPYISIDTAAGFDQNLINLWASTAATAPAGVTYRITNDDEAQVALALTGGYRAKMGVPGHQAKRGNTRDGLYFAANYNYLYGFLYDRDNMTVTFDTDSGGLITIAPTTTPILINRETSSKGRGFSLDFSTAIVVDNWEASFSVDGIANRIDWEDREAEQHVLNSILNGGDFVTIAQANPTGSRRVELPQQYVGSAAYHVNKKVTLMGDVQRRFQGTEFHAGAEYRLAIFEVRGGGRYTNHMFNPSFGAGINLTKGFGVDVGFFTSAPNVERTRKLSTAISLRFGG